ncbi:MAG TPA: GNAT family N-acetyltransferase [Pyrinomonadaceae bacterium]|nr:GNAT family N-acetyltransferase [Pyrinomonadaceae bacterium]
MATALQDKVFEQPAQFVADEVETARLRLRMFTPEDLDALAAIAADPEVMRYIGAGKPLVREEVKYNLATIINGFRRRGFGRWAVVRKDSGAFVGYCGLTRGQEEVGVEIAYMLARDEWGKGLATEAARACLRYGFEKLGCDSIAALTRHENMRSRRVMERIGMRYVRDGHYYGFDCVCYAISREEWSLDGSIYRVTR